MVRMTQKEYDWLALRNIKVRPAKPPPITQQKNTRCASCGGALPGGRQKYCCDKCQVGIGSTRGPYGKVKEPKGLKLNRCRYCGRLANSNDMHSISLPDTFGIKWFRCCCHPEEAQLYDTSDMEDANARI